MIWLYFLLFIASAVFLFYSSSKIVGFLLNISFMLGIREFILGFFVMAFAGSLPNLFLGINSAFQKIPQLSFGDIIGGNIVDLTLVIGLAALLSPTAIPAESKMVQKSAIFCFVIAILPLLLVFDGYLSREDGIILIFSFLIYVLWLFSKKDRFAKTYYNVDLWLINRLSVKNFLLNFIKIIFFLIILLAATEGIIISAKEFSKNFNISIPIIGLLLIGLLNCLPETYFSIASARKNQNWMILGDLMGSVIVCATVVLGIVALIQPIEIRNFSPFVAARFFLIVAAIFFYIIVKTGQRITKLEALILSLIYFAFLISEAYFIDFFRFLV
jgi:cation:H+ antiporter